MFLHGDHATSIYDVTLCISFQDYPCSYSEVRLAFKDQTKSYNFNGPSDNPEVKRRNRVASYNMYAVEGIDT